MTTLRLGLAPLIFLIALCALPTKADAACTSPAATAGSLNWNTSTTQFQYCDGTAWQNFGGGSTFTAGTVGAPGWAVTGDTDTGLWAPAANTLSISSGGVEAARFNTVASGVNYLNITPSATGSSVTIGAAGSDTNVGLALSPKGTGYITSTMTPNLGTTSATGPAANGLAVSVNPTVTLTKATSGINAQTVTGMNSAIDATGITMSTITSSARNLATVSALASGISGSPVFNSPSGGLLNSLNVYGLNSNVNLSPTYTSGNRNATNAYGAVLNAAITSSSGSQSQSATGVSINASIADSSGGGGTVNGISVSASGNVTGSVAAVNASASSSAAGSATTYGGYLSSSGNATNMFGVYATASSSGATASTTLYGTYSQANLGTTTATGYGAFNEVSNQGSTTTTAYGTFTDVLSGSGSIGTGYGLYIGGVAGTTNYGIYQAGTSQNYLAGSLRLAASNYLNFGATAGSTGYGVRDNAGTIECKNSGGTWAACAGGGGTTFAAGTVGAPGWAVTGDAGTGLSSPATSTISISAGGVEVSRYGTVASAVNYLTFQPGVAGSPGSVTIGSAGASADIDIFVQPKGAGRFYVAGSAGSQVMSTTTSTTGRAIYGYASDGAGSTYGGYFQSTSTNGTGVFGYASSSTGLNYGGYFSSNSNGGVSLFSLASNAGTKVLVVKGAASQSADLAQFQNSSGTALTVINASGNVGIGTASPLAQFTLGAGGQTNVVSYTSVNQAHLQYYTAQNFPVANNYQRVLDVVAGGDGGNSAGSNIRFLTAPGNSGTAVSRVLIDPNGNVGIATASPSTTLDVNGTATIRNMSAQATTMCFLGGTGTVGFCSSDRRLKHDIRYLTGETTGVGAIMALKPARFFWNGNARKMAGFIAQDTMHSIPEAVYDQPNSKYLGFDSTAVLSYAVKAIQELKADNDNLRHALDELRRANQTR